MNDLRKILDDVVAEAGANWGETERELARRLVVQAIELPAQAAMGNDVTEYVAAVKAAALNLTAAAEIDARTIIQRTVHRALARGVELLAGALLG